MKDDGHHELASKADVERVGSLEKPPPPSSPTFSLTLSNDHGSPPHPAWCNSVSGENRHLNWRLLGCACPLNLSGPARHCTALTFHLIRVHTLFASTSQGHHIQPHSYYIFNLELAHQLTRNGHVTLINYLRR